MASMKIGGRNLESTILTLGPTSLSDNILAKSSAVFSLTPGFVAFENKSNKYITAPTKTNRIYYSNDIFIPVLQMTTDMFNL